MVTRPPVPRSVLAANNQWQDENTGVIYDIEPKEKPRYRCGTINFTVHHIVQDSFQADEEVELFCLIHYIRQSGKLTVTKRYVKDTLYGRWQPVNIEDRDLIHTMNQEIKNSYTRILKNGSDRPD